MVLDHDVGIVVGVGVHWAVLKLVRLTQHGQKHISGHQDQHSTMSGS